MEYSLCNVIQSCKDVKCCILNFIFFLSISFNACFVCFIISIVWSILFTFYYLFHHSHLYLLFLFILSSFSKNAIFMYNSCCVFFIDTFLMRESKEISKFEKLIKKINSKFLNYASPSIVSNFIFFDSGADDVIRRELEQSCRRNLNYYNSEVYHKSENCRDIDIGRYYGESVISIPICTKEKLKKSSDKFHLSLNQLYLSYNHDMISIIKSYTKGILLEIALFIYLFIFFLLYYLLEENIFLINISCFLMSIIFLNISIFRIFSY